MKVSFAGDSDTAVKAISSQPNGGSGHEAGSAERHDEKGTGHQAPEARKHGRHHHEFETAAFDLHATKRVAHDDEGRGKNEKRHGRKGARRDALLKQAETGRPLHDRLKSRCQRARKRETDAKRQQGIQRIRRHVRLTNATNEMTAPASQNWRGTATTSLRKG